MSYETKFRKNILNKEGTIGNVLNSHRDELFACNTADELKTMLNKLFEENKLTSPKAKQTLLKLVAMNSLDNMFLYIQNIIFASSKLATY